MQILFKILKSCSTWLPLKFRRRWFSAHHRDRLVCFIFCPCLSNNWTLVNLIYFRFLTKSKIINENCEEFCLPAEGSFIILSYNFLIKNKTKTKNKQTNKYAKLNRYITPGSPEWQTPLQTTLGLTCLTVVLSPCPNPRCQWSIVIISVSSSTHISE